MTGTRESSSVSTPSEGTDCGPFLERVRQALGHDLHTPLGTIANYAAILEYQAESKPEEVRVLAGKIRSSAMRMSAMLRQMADAVVLSETLPEEVPVDPSGLVRTLASELNLRLVFPARGHEPSAPVPVDRELLTFVWRAFLSVNAEAAEQKALDLDLEVEQTPSETALILWIGSRASDAQRPAAWARFSEDPAGIPAEGGFALGFAEWLIRNRGGDLGLWGHPGQSAGLRIAFAPNS